MFKQILKSCALSLVIFLLLLEGASYLYILFVNPNIPLPTYRVIDASNRFWCDIDEHFGVWHQPHATYLHNKACFTQRAVKPRTLGRGYKAHLNWNFCL